MGDRCTQVYSSPILLLDELSTTREMLEQAKRTIEVLLDTPAAGIDDVRSGRIRSLDCIDGGCERDKWREIARELAERLEDFVSGSPWKCLSCCKNGPTEGCALCGRYYDANAALAKARAAGLLDAQRSAEPGAQNG